MSSCNAELENISDKNRPMNIKGKYEQFTSGEWLEVKIQVDTIENVPENEKLQVLCSVIQVGYIYLLINIISIQACFTINMKYNEVIDNVSNDNFMTRSNQ